MTTVFRRVGALMLVLAAGLWLWSSVPTRSARAMLDEVDIELGWRHGAVEEATEPRAGERRGATVTEPGEILRLVNSIPDRRLNLRGYWYVPEPAAYEFHARGGGRTRIEIDGEMVADSARGRGRTLPRIIEVRAGTHRIDVSHRPASDRDDDFFFGLARPGRKPQPFHDVAARRLGKKRAAIFNAALERLERAATATSAAGWLTLLGILALTLPIGVAGARGSRSVRVGLVVALAGSWLGLLHVWFSDPGIPGTAALRAWDPMPLAVATLVLALLVARSFSATLRAMVRELRGPLREVDFRGLGFVLLVAILVHAPLLMWPMAAVDADSAINALAGKHIADGRVAPAFYYGSLLTGTISAHVAGALTWLFGPSTRWLLLVERGLYLAFLGAFFALLQRGFGRRVAVLAGFWVALSSYTLLTDSTYAEYPEILFFSAAGILTLTLIMESRVQHRAWWGVLGFLLGFGSWGHPLIVSTVATALAASGLVIWLRREGRAITPLLAGLTLGLSPAIVALGRDIPFLLGFLFTGDPDVPARVLPSPLTALVDAFRVAIPVTFGGFRHRYELSPIGTATLAAVLVGCAGWLSLRAWRCMRGQEFDALALRPQSTVPILLACLGLMHLAAFSLSPFRVLTFPPRYFVPLVLSLPALVTAAVDLQARRLRAPLDRVASVVVVVAIALFGFRSVPEHFRDLRTRNADIAASIQEILAAGIDHCEAGYWDAYQLTHASMERVLCESTGPQRIGFYSPMVAQRQTAEVPPTAFSSINEELAARRRRFLDERNVRYEILDTPMFDLIVVPPTGIFRDSARRRGSDRGAPPERDARRPR